ncbi:MAG: hypothetical protein IJ761_00845 [Bacteroidales bacterium]|nr:hypothetical protein [Bacteroidales bacterium]
MFSFRRIALSLPIAMLLLFGCGGVGLVRCACTGHTSLNLPTDGCCSGADCMQLSISKVSDANLASESTSLHIPEVDLFISTPFLYLFPSGAQPISVVYGHFLAPSPPMLGQLSMVMRV